MPAIDPVPHRHLRPVLREQIEAARASRALSSDLAVRIWAHRPELAEAQLALLRALHERRILDGRLAELVRLRIADINDCRACKAGRKSDDVTEDDVQALSADRSRFTDREDAALRFAETFAFDHTRIGDADLAELGRYFSVPEIVELGMFAAQMVASGRLAHVLRAYADDDVPPVLGA
ncbi:AhpD family alkylhydroperoxidase [Actinocorallia herbida]|uniref:AhpD family alkylhydroperoxidase n=1 Tax=Actinocorallia herbida TaxID=58109 RepID=A0A3N1D3D5_9ACTN|nr:carboxymuconolactone decarboxylase family protein [Actinocorallia herbida]ROO88020.1 AhpD family alkylhydroperoxidase [Actinocorallia herbida]